MIPIRARRSRPEDDGLDPAQRAFAQQLGAALRDSEAPDYVRSARLAAARARALEAAARPAALGWLGSSGGRLGLAGAAASLMLALLVATQPSPFSRPEAVPPAPPTAQVDALELLLDEHGPEFYEDLELYEWLDEHA